jgi:hypothetical protein
MQKRKSTSNKPDYRGKKRYRREKNVIHKKKKEEKLKQRKVK